MSKIGLLDTTMAFHKRDPYPGMKQHVENFLKGFGLLGTSTFAHLEFKRSYIADLSYLHRMLKRNGNVSDTLLHVTKNLTASGLTRMLTNVISHLVHFTGLEDNGFDEKNFDVLLDHIENAVEFEHEGFLAGLFVHDGTGCVRSKEPPIVRDGMIDVTVEQCRPNKIKCRIHTFFQDKREEFLAMKEHISGLVDKTKQLERIETIIGQADQNPTMLCDDSVCRNFGDALIAMDCLTGHPVPVPGVVSSNVNDYAPLCASLNVTFYQYTPPPLPPTPHSPRLKR